MDQEIQGGGTIDSGDTLPFAGAVTNNGSNGLCSGTLVTPFWVLTAEHCIGGSTQNKIITLHPDPASAPPANIRSHTAQTNPVKKFVAGDDEDETDMALFRLDMAVPPTVASPKNPPLTAGACGSAWEGTLIGYSSSGLSSADVAVGVACPPTWGCSDPEPVGQNLRRFSVTSDWDRNSFSAGDDFSNEFWGVWGGQCDWYEGSTDGDSGGPLLRTNNQMLCGVISGKEKPMVCAVFPSPGFMWITNVTAATDSQPAIDWMTSFILDADGLFEGQCAPPNAFNDPDGDGIPSKCDNCPAIANANQLDFEADGVGDACSACPGQSITNLNQNCNREVELAKFYELQSLPPQAAMPVIQDAGIVVGGTTIKTFASQAEADQAKLQLRLTVAPDACDPVPCPLQSLTDGGALPSGSLPPVPPACPGQDCSWDIENRIDIKPKTTAEIQAVGSTVAATEGLRWCHCPVGDTSTWAGRVQCATSGQYGCEIHENLYTPGGLNPWLEITTTDDPVNQLWENGKEWQVPITLPATTRTAYWDFFDLGAAYLTTSGNYQGVKGVLWTHTLGLSQGVPGLATALVPTYSNSFGPGNAYANFAITPFEWVEVDWDIFCKYCDWGVTDLFRAVINPAFAISTPSGLANAPVLDATTEQFYGEVAEGNLRSVKASEPADLAAQLIPNATLYSGLGLDWETGAAHYKVELPAFGVPRANPTTIPGPPTMGADRGIALSSTLGRLFVFGGTQDQEPIPDSWMLDIESGVWTELDLNEASLPKSILSAAYRPHDRAIYFLERLGTDLLLRRYDVMRRHPEGGAFTNLVKFPSAWDGASRYEVTIGTERDVAVTAVRPQSYYIARFKIDDAQRVTYAKLWTRRGALISTPRLRYEGVSFSIAVGDEPRFTMRRHDEAVQGTSSETPVVL